MADLTIGFDIENIGPHTSVNFNGKSASLKTAIYANNGSGKTFISRLFRLIENPIVEKSDKLLSFTKTQGKMKFEVSYKEENQPPIVKTLELNISKGATPTFSSPLPFIFHVFNSDYVHENIEALGYKPDGNIEGYILGKSQIDLTKEKKELIEKNENLEKKKQEFEQRINTQKIMLDEKDLGIRKNITEYTSFTIENIFRKNNFGYVESKSFEELKKENTILNTLPDDSPDVTLNRLDITTDFFGHIEQLLKYSYSKSHFAEEFKGKIKAKQGFIESGLKIIDDNKCPFCEQILDEQALELIDTYTKYLTNEEAKIISQIDSYIKKAEEVKKQIDNAYKISLRSKTDFDDLKKYLPSFKEQNIELLQDLKAIEDDFNTVSIMLNDKKGDISKSLSVEQHIENIEEFKRSNSNVAIENNKKIDQINKAKNNTNNEKLNIKKRLCKAKYLATLQAEIKNIDEIIAFQNEIQTIDKNISDKENQAKALKKDKVVEAFEDFLNVFFAGKYTFDKENFCLKFNTHNLISNASDVLSDGEKSIVAFCFFLAETHKKVEKEADYQKLFFVIDDPISSLDGMTPKY